MNRENLLNGMDDRHILFGSLLSLSNVFQTTLDRFFSEITSKQFFLLICMNLFSEHDPSINALAASYDASDRSYIKPVLEYIQK